MPVNLFLFFYFFYGLFSQLFNHFFDYIIPYFFTSFSSLYFLIFSPFFTSTSGTLYILHSFFHFLLSFPISFKLTLLLLPFFIFLHLSFFYPYCRDYIIPIKSSSPSTNSTSPLVCSGITRQRLSSSYDNSVIPWLDITSGRILKVEGTYTAWHRTYSKCTVLTHHEETWRRRHKRTSYNGYQRSFRVTWDEFFQWYGSV